MTLHFSIRVLLLVFGPLFYAHYLCSLVHVCSPLRLQVEQCASLLESTTFSMNALEEGFFERMETVLMEIKKGVKLSHNVLVNIAGELDLKSNQEILQEASVLEKKKSKAHLRKEKDEEELVNLLISLATQVADDLVEQKRLQEDAKGVSIPADFRCPLSLELMSDPVIIASGQTYERTYIQQWLDQGNTTCPKTREPLSHLNLIPNYIVKAFIMTWSESNGVSVPDPEKSQSIPYVPLQPSDDHLNHRVIKEPSPPVSLSLTGGNPIDSSSCHGNVHTVEDGDFDSTNVTDSNMHLRVFHSENASSSSHVSCLGDSFAALTLPNDSSCDVSLASSSLPASVHHASVVSRRRAETNSLGIEQSKTDLAGDDDRSDNVRRVQTLVQELQSPVTSTQSNAVKELRLLSKHTMENRIVIANCGAIPHLVTLLHSEDPDIQENAVTALLNLSLNDNNKSEIAAANAITPLVHVLEVGTSAAKENAAGALLSLCVMDENKVAIGRSGAVEPLVDLLINGSPRGKKDAVSALYNLSLHADNKQRIVEANAIRPLLGLVTDPASGLVEKAVLVIQNLAYISLGRESIGREGGIAALVEVVETGSQRGKENAAGALFRLCMHSGRFRAITLQEGAIPPLVYLARSGTPRAKEKVDKA